MKMSNMDFNTKMEAAREKDGSKRANKQTRYYSIYIGDRNLHFPRYKTRARKEKIE